MLVFSCEDPKSIGESDIYDLLVNSAEDSNVYINGETDLSTSVYVNGGGDGSAGNPYIIENYEIYASSDHGIYIEATTSYIIIRGCSISWGNVGAYNGIQLRYCENVKIENNILFENEIGIFLYDENHFNNISFNNISGNDIGLKLFYSDHNLITENNITDNLLRGVDHDHSNSNTFEGNDISYNGMTGFSLSLSDEVTLFDNTFSYNAEYGVITFNSKWNKFEGNNISENLAYGLFINSLSTNNSFSKNDITGNGLDGIYLNSLCTYNNITRNTIMYNENIGIHAKYSPRDNTIWNNTISHNVIYNAYYSDSSSANNWDNGSQGNYWGDYGQRYPTAVNQGGHWDIPYEIQGTIGDVDNFPILDWESPIWNGSIEDQYINTGESFFYEITAHDNGVLDSYWLNDTSIFSINEEGIITNTSALFADTTHFLRIFVNDTAGHQIHGDFSITVLEVQYFYLTIISDYSTPTGEGWYMEGSSIIASLSSEIEPGISGVQYLFAEWGGDGAGTDYAQSEPIFIDGDKTVTAIWTTQFYLTVTSDHGSPIGEGWYDSGSTPAVGVDAGVIAGVTGTRYAFTSWEGDAAGYNYAGSDAITMDAPKTATAVWNTQYYLTVISDYSTPLGQGWYDAGSTPVVEVDAGVVEGVTGTRYAFTSWGGDATGDNHDGSDTITMDGPKTATANWQTQYLLSISVTPEGLTPIPTPDPVGPWYGSGSEITLTAEPLAGYEFQGWLVDGADYFQESEISLMMAEPHSVVAIYDEMDDSTPPPSVIPGFLGLGVVLPLVGLCVLGKKYRQMQ